MTVAPPRALVYSPGLAGHREIYVRVLTGIFLARGYEVVVATDCGERKRTAGPLIEELEADPRCTVVNLGREAGGGAGVSWRRLLQLEGSLGVAVTVLTEADDMVAALLHGAGRWATRPAGRMLGIFLRTTNYDYGVWPAAMRRTPARFHARMQGSRPPLDAALCLDERFVARHPQGHAWLPDISVDFCSGDGAGDDCHLSSGGGRDETELWSRRLREFLAGQDRRPLLVYIGSAQLRRGYDRLLRLALETDAAVAHCGRRMPDTGAEAAALRDELLARGRLLETDGPYQDPATADAFIQAANCVVLPYREHLGSSGIMLQALRAGRPVVAPDEGLMGWRTRTFDLGVVTRPGDDRDLARGFRELDRAPGAYGDRLAAYMSHFTRERVTDAIAAAAGWGGAGAPSPLAAAEAAAATAIADDAPAGREEAVA